MTDRHSRVTEESMRSQLGKLGPLASIARLGCGFVAFVLVPLLATWWSPAQWISLERTPDGGTRAVVRTCVVFVVPFETVRIEDLREVEADVEAGRTERQKTTGGRSERVHYAEQGMLTLRGADREVTVQLAPSQLERASRTVTDVLHGKEDRATVYGVAAWFPVLVQAPFTLLGFFWIVGVLLSPFRLLAKRRRGTSRRTS